MESAQLVIPVLYSTEHFQVYCPQSLTLELLLACAQPQSPCFHAPPVSAALHARSSITAAQLQHLIVPVDVVVDMQVEFASNVEVACKSRC